MKTTPFTTSAGDFLAVAVPKSSHSFKVSNVNSWISWLSKPDENKLCDMSPLHELPPGKWQILCKQSEMTEELAKGIVESGYSHIRHSIKPKGSNPLEERIINGKTFWIENEEIFYKDYLFKPHYRDMVHLGSLPTALESFNSLMDSLEIDNECLILKKV